MNYQDKLYRLSERRNSGLTTDSFNFSMEEGLRKSITERDKAFTYVIEAMKPLPIRSTEISYEEGNKVKKHLSEELLLYNLGATFEYQGSVTCNTHIKYHSDIDLLVIIDRFQTVENTNRITIPYQGNCKQDLIDLRTACIKILKQNYSVADVESNSKSVKISGGSLRRDIDVVPCNWYNSEKYYTSGCSKTYRGIQIIDSKTKERDTNYPFLNIKRIEDKDKDCLGLYRPIVRLAKTIKEDSEEKINISSYDIQALFFNMDNVCYTTTNGDPLLLIQNVTEYLTYLKNNPSHFNELRVPDGTRYISDRTPIGAIDRLYIEFENLFFNIRH